MSHLQSFSLDGQNHKFIREAEFAYYNCPPSTVYSFAPDQVFGFSSPSISLPLDNFSCQDNAFYVENRQRLLVDQDLLLGLTAELGGDLLDPLKATNVQNLRAMTTWCLAKR